MSVDTKITPEVASFIDSTVEKLLKAKEDTEMRKEIEEALSKSTSRINELTEEAQSKDATIEELNTKISDLQQELSAANEEKEGIISEKTQLEEAKTSLESEKEDLSTKLEEATNELTEMKKASLMATRMEELEKAGVASKSDKGKETQAAKISDMSDEEFASYKEELVSVREDILAELKAKESSSDDEGEDKTEEKATVEEDKDLEKEIASSKSTAVNPTYAASAALNLEVVPSKDVMEKYSKLGKAMAARISKNSNRGGE